MLSDLELLNSSEENLNWFQENSAKIQEDYPEKIVAIRDKKIIAYGENFKVLMKNLNRKGVDESEVLIEVISKPGEITIL